MPTSIKTLTGFNQYPAQICTLSRPERYRELLNLQQPTIARGQGCSYGDASLNENKQVTLTERLNCFITFNREQGILTADAGITIAKILATIVPQGWFLPVTPGTQHVSLGGCVAADVHGKNHHHVGSFGQHVTELELIDANRQVTYCSPQKNADIFWATIGGMGLTGIISKISLQLIPVSSNQMLIKHYPAGNLEELLLLLNDSVLDDQYSIAWFDVLATKNQFGRSIMMTAHHANTTSYLEMKKKQLSIPFNLPSWMLNKSIVKIFNEFYFHENKNKNEFTTHYTNYLYPLDHIQNWNRLYGKRGFIQYQCVLPMQTAADAIKQLLEYLHTTNYPAFLGTLKRFGEQSQGLLSFPLHGFTLALDLPIRNAGLFTILDKMDNMVVNHGGRIYLAKDARLQPETFRAMYPRFTEWLAIKNRIDPEHFFCSSLSRRLQIT